MRLRRIEETEINLMGKVTIAARDFDGSLLAVNIEGDSGNFLVDDTDSGRDLLCYTGSVVEASGWLRREDGVAILRVGCFKVLNSQR